MGVAVYLLLILEFILFNDAAERYRTTLQILNAFTQRLVSIWPKKNRDNGIVAIYLKRTHTPVFDILGLIVNKFPRNRYLLAFRS